MDYIVQIDGESIILESSDRKRRFYNGETTNYNIYVKLYPEYFGDYKNVSNTNPYNYTIEKDVDVVTSYTGYDYPSVDIGKDGDVYKMIGSNYVYNYTNHSISLVDKGDLLSYSKDSNIGFMVPEGHIKTFDLNLEDNLVKITFDEDISLTNKYINILGNEYKLDTIDYTFTIDDLDLYNSIIDLYNNDEYINLTVVDREYRGNKNYTKVDGNWILNSTSSVTDILITDIGGDIIDLN